MPPYPNRQKNRTLTPSCKFSENLFPRYFLVINWTLPTVKSIIRLKRSKNHKTNYRDSLAIVRLINIFVSAAGQDIRFTAKLTVEEFNAA